MRIKKVLEPPKSKRFLRFEKEGERATEEMMVEK